VAHYQKILGDKRLLIIDEAQKIPEIGQILKLMVDGLPEVAMLVTGSSAFDISHYTGEPLTGRKKTFYLFPLAEREYEQIEDPVQQIDGMKNRLVFGNYPELLHLPSTQAQTLYLQELVNDYLLRDILAFDNLRNSDKILSLLRLIAFQVGEEVSMQELGQQLSMSKNTVERYLDLLKKVFVIFQIKGFSRNLRKEVTKNSKWYFFDNGLRNVLVANLSPLANRDDQGKLWENYAISERVKQQRYEQQLVNNYFWRTYDQQEIDWVEERGGKLYGYELKWNPKRKARVPSAWQKAYPEAEFQVINPENFLTWLES